MERIVKKVEEPYLKEGLPTLNPGDTVKVVTKVIEGDKSRFQTFEGVVLSIQGEGLGKSVKVRKISYGVGVERTFPLHSPNIDSFEVVKKGAPRRAKLFYLRDRVGKRALKVRTRKKKIEYEELLKPSIEIAPEVGSHLGEESGGQSVNSTESVAEEKVDSQSNQSGVTGSPVAHQDPPDPQSSVEKGDKESG